MIKFLTILAVLLLCAVSSLPAQCIGCDPPPDCAGCHSATRTDCSDCGAVPTPTGGGHQPVIIIMDGEELPALALGRKRSLSAAMKAASHGRTLHAVNHDDPRAEQALRDGGHVVYGVHAGADGKMLPDDHAASVADVRKHPEKYVCLALAAKPKK